MPAKGDANPALQQINSWASTLYPRTEHILQLRLGAIDDQIPLNKIAPDLGLTHQRVAQIQQEIELDFAHVTSNHKTTPAATALRRLSARLGAAIPAAHAHNIIQDLGLQDYALLMLQAAGPYRARKDWLLRTSSANTDPTQQVISLADQNGVIDPEQLRQVYNQWGLHHEMHVPWLSLTRPARRTQHGVILEGHSLNQRLKQSLSILGKPSTPTALREHSGETLTERTIVNRLSVDPTFARTDKTHWALREWNLQTYDGCLNEIRKTLLAQGPTPFYDLVKDLSQKFDLTRDTIKTNLRSPMFKTTDGVVDIRPDNAPHQYKPLGTYALPPGLFIHGPQRATKLLKITTNHLRGSSQPLGRTLSQILQIPQGSTQEYRLTSGGTLNITHRKGSTTGPAIQSLRQTLNDCHAQKGNLLSITLDAREQTIALTVTDPAQAEPNWLTIQALTGIGPDPQDPHQALAQALNCPPHLLKDTLKARGDDLVLNLLPAQNSKEEPCFTKHGKKEERTAPPRPRLGESDTPATAPGQRPT